MRSKTRREKVKDTPPFPERLALKESFPATGPRMKSGLPGLHDIIEIGAILRLE
jgi:hypothetical protein